MAFSGRTGGALALVALLLAARLAAAQNLVTERLAGEVLFGGATLVDPPPGEAAGTHAYLTITGAAARACSTPCPDPRAAMPASPAGAGSGRGT